MHHRILAGAALALVLTACAPGPGPLFDDEGGAPVTCMIHQPADPGERYRDPALRNTGETLDLLRYYTAHGTLPYCDGTPPTDTDRAWMRVYVELGGAPDRIAAP